MSHGQTCDKAGRLGLDRYIESGEFQYPVGPMIQLKAKFSRSAATHLYETPLSDDQVIENLDTDHVIVTALVHDTAQLEWWLSGFGHLVEVQEPPDLRRRMIRAATLLNEVYDSGGSAPRSGSY